MAICVPSPPISHVPFQEEVLDQAMASIATFTSSSPPFRLTTSQKVSDSDGSTFRAYGPSSPSLLHVNNTCQASPIALAIDKNFNVHSPPLSIDDLLPILVNCLDCKNLTQARHAHLLLCNYGLEDHSKIINYVVPMFVSCGSAVNAQQALVRSSDHCNEHAWTTLIQGFIDSGDSWHALNLYDDMQETSVIPSGHTFVALLKACTKQRWLERGWDLHTEITKLGLEDHPFLGNTLVGLYARCGTPQESRSVFNQLLTRDVVSWNALLAGYSENGWAEETITSINEMESQGVSPDCITYTCGVKACSNSSEEALQMGQTLHAEIIKKGIETDDLLGSGLVIMYANCGALAEGGKVFNELVVDNGMACNALMAGFMEKGLFKEVLQFSTQLPDVSAFAGSLKVYGIMEATGKGQELHSALVKRGYDNDSFLGSGLVGMYAKCNLLLDAQKVFDHISARDTVCWTALISGYAESGLGEEALACYDQMQVENLSPCALLFTCTLKACCTISDVDRGRNLHGEVTKRGFEKHSFVGSALVDLYAKCGFLEEAKQVFDNLEAHDTVTWTALITGYVEHGFGEEALTCLECMQAQGVCPDVVMLVASLKAYAGTGSLHGGRAIHAEVAKRGFEKEYIICIGLINMYGKCGCLSDANMVFSKLLNRDVVSWNAMIAGYAGHGLLEEASCLFQEMQLAGVSADIISWNSLIMGYAEQGESKGAYSLFLQMQEQGMPPTDVVLLSVLKACGNMSALQIGKRIHVHVCGLSGGVVSHESSVSTILIEMYSKCGSTESAQDLFDSFTSAHIRMWDVLIRGYARQGDFNVVSDLLQKMTADGIPPDGVLFLNVLNVCAHMGLVEMGQNCFHTMSREYGISPSFKHQTCIVSLLCRAGQLEEAAALIKQMPLPSNLVMWSCMLDSCRKWGNVELGRWAFDQAICVRELDSSPFILMSNIYTDAGMIDAAKSIDELRLKWVSGRMNML
ncbi:hypothetical protein GOP47_0015144 [Adiantum capillus-veneris]|uniref:Pentatricopeptide repeat-containing protein n=1 Tax=Adiantum capillus-veneris TaxID=13818 RepID=A0A9D4UNH2_ADICA|nr:hypothetical protein GOP47_0015144 [Adiantum capillus-veneris]